MSIGVRIRFGHFDFENLNLFRISIFEFRIYSFCINLRPMQSFLRSKPVWRLHAEIVALVLSEALDEL